MSDGGRDAPKSDAATAAYVDLNPIRAALTAEQTSVDARLSEQLAGAAADAQRKEKAAEARDRRINLFEELKINA